MRFSIFRRDPNHCKENFLKNTNSESMFLQHHGDQSVNLLSVDDVSDWHKT